MTEHNCIAEIHEIFADNGISGVLLWGEHAMSLHGIPTVVQARTNQRLTGSIFSIFIQTDYMTLNDYDVDRTAAALVSKGWRELSLADPPSPPDFWISGWKEFMGSGRRFLYPEDVLKQELVLLPRSYLGLDSLHLSQILTDSSSGFNYPSAIVLANSVALMSYKSTGHCALLMRAWAAYFIQYNVLKEEELDELVEKGNTEFWKELRQLSPA